MYETNSAHYVILGTLSLLLSIASALHALLHKRDPYACLTWVFVSLSVPFLGPLLYVILGINRIRRQANKLMDKSKTSSGPSTLSAPPDRTEPLIQEYHSIDNSTQLVKPFTAQNGNYLKEHPNHLKAETVGLGILNKSASSLAVPSHFLDESVRVLAEVGYSVTGYPLLTGNKVEILYNGDETYPAMLEAIKNATTFIWLDTYIFDSDHIGLLVANALIEAHQRGVEVRVHVDGIGTMMTRPRIDKFLNENGVKTARFIPPRLFPPQFSINLRNHRKILIVDGKCAFTGGINISDRHVINQPIYPEKLGGKKYKIKERSQDVHFRIEGPILDSFQRVFIREWSFSAKENLQLRPIHLQDNGATLCRCILDGPDNYFERFQSTLLGVISAAKHRIQIMTPYFLPQRELISALQSAAKRGVQVEIILPAKLDHKFVQWASENILWEFVGKGVNIYKQPAPFAHSKILLIDDGYSHIGSANMDPRSFRLNFELTVECLDIELSQKLRTHFEEIKASSTLITKEYINSIPFLLRVRNAAFWMFSPYL